MSPLDIRKKTAKAKLIWIKNNLDYNGKEGLWLKDEL